MQRVTLKTSTIFIGKGDQTHVFHSVNEVPQGLRKELEESTNGFNSATILIADRRGREEIRRALNGLPTALRTRLAPSLSETATPITGYQPAVEPNLSYEPESSWIGRHWWKLAVPAAAILGWLAYQFR